MLAFLMAVKSRREEYAEATRRALLDAAAELFSTRGYAATSIEDVVRSARVTRGALYHHFSGKRELFETVFAELEGEVAGRLGALLGADADPWERFLAGIDAALDACLDPRFRRLALQEGLAALGYQRWRELGEQQSMGVLHQGLEALMAAGVLAPQPVDLLTRVLFAALAEAALAIADAQDERDAHEQARELLHRLLDGLRSAPGSATSATSDSGA
jgi:AcrR family transcriptional regulator